MVAVLEKMKSAVALHDIFDDLEPVCRTIHVSGSLHFIKTTKDCGNWLHVNGMWHRRLDTPTYLWLRHQVRTAIASGKLTSQSSEALAQLATIESTGLQAGSFTAAEILGHCRAPQNFVWADGVPRWAEWVDECWR